MQYGDAHINTEELELYLGFNPANENLSRPVISKETLVNSLENGGGLESAVNQRDADLLHYWHKVCTGFLTCSVVCVGSCES